MSTEESRHVCYIGLAPCCSSLPRISSLNKLSKFVLHRTFVADGKRAVCRARVCFGGSSHFDKNLFLITFKSSLNKFSKFLLHRRFVAVEKPAVRHPGLFLEVPPHFDKIWFVIDRMKMTI